MVRALTIPVGHGIDTVLVFSAIDSVPYFKLWFFVSSNLDQPLSFFFFFFRLAKQIHEKDFVVVVVVFFVMLENRKRKPHTALHALRHT